VAVTASDDGRSPRATTNGTPPTFSGLTGSPALDLGSKPELDPAFPEIEYGGGHVVIALLVLEDGVAVREAEDFGHTFGVDQVLGRDAWHRTTCSSRNQLRRCQHHVAQDSLLATK
jgi:hypothetical protein